MITLFRALSFREVKGEGVLLACRLRDAFDWPGSDMEPNPSAPATAVRRHERRFSRV